MVHILRALLACACIATSGAASQAQEYIRAELKIRAPWARASESKTASAFMTIENAGKAGDRLIAASSPLAKRVTLQHFVEVDGAMARKRIAAIAVPPGGDVKMEPGEYHLILFGLKRPLAVGQTVKMTLTFERAGAVSIEAPVLPAGAMTAPKPPAEAAKPAVKRK